MGKKSRLKKEWRLERETTLARRTLPDPRGMKVTDYLVSQGFAAQNLEAREEDQVCFCECGVEIDIDGCFPRQCPFPGTQACLMDEMRDPEALKQLFEIYLA